MGVLVQGELLPGGSEREWCDSEVLRRVRRASLAHLRREVEPAGRDRFAAFQASDCASVHAVREVRRLEVEGEAGGRIEIAIEATAFVKHMVRNIVGTLVEVGQGKRSPASIAGLLESRDRTRAGATAPPQGLLLERVFYDE